MRWILIQYEDFELNVNLLKTLRKFLEVDVRQAGFVMEAECIEKNISIKVRYKLLRVQWPCIGLALHCVDTFF